MPEENIYDLLQVESTVDSRAIRAAYRRAAYDNELFGWVEELAPEPGPEGTRPTPGKVAF